ncbi:MAG TPA: DUF488 domain-containing protein [Nitrospira sp.]|jgi:uncharacterized protein (DUF488 family)
MTLWTIGHSTKAINEFLALLKSHGITRLVDVRTIPRSRHNPQFDAHALDMSLEEAGITYIHQPQLGGLRKPKKDSINEGWKNASFRGYADYMQTELFWAALETLTKAARNGPTAIMCAEAVPWRCHRSLIADALASRAWTVRHIMTKTKADTHRMTRFAVIDHARIFYPSTPPPHAQNS